MAKIKKLYEDFINSTGVCTDTRNILEGCLFFALKGANFDGNQFAEEALSQGAAKVVVDDDNVVKGNSYILVDNVLSTLQDLSNYHRKALGIPIIGITGSNGKTTTKELLSAVLNQKYKVLATVGNYNNHIGVPLTLLSLKEDIELAVVEMGANHIGEIDFLCKIAEPNMGIITNVGKAHLEGFGSFEGVKQAKGELYRFIENNTGVLFVNKSNDHLMEMLGKGSEVFFYGNDQSCQVKLIEIKKTPNLKFSCNIKEKEIFVNSKLVGQYNLENALAAISVGTYFNVEEEKIVEAINNYEPNNNRSQLIITDKNEVLLDAYNANPTSMKAALENFVVADEENKAVILGEMKELGVDSEKEHQALIDFVNESNFNSIYVVGESYRHLLQGTNNISWFKNVDSLRKHLVYSPLKDAFVLVKGSRSNKLEQLKEVL